MKKMIKSLVDITTIWDAKYNTNTGATISADRKVKNVSATEIKNGFYRGSEINGVFEVARPDDPIRGKLGKLKVEVLCGWFGMKPRTTSLHIKLTGKRELLESYSGNVALNITCLIK